jgi:hypothetical protein
VILLAFRRYAGAATVFYDAMPGTWGDTDAAARFVGETQRTVREARS